jgi:hypothetical protein
MKPKALQIDERDNVATVTSNVASGEEVDVLSPDGSVVGTPRVLESIALGHKVALDDLGAGDKVIKYGEVIGVASRAIKAGDWVHVHNVESATVPTSKLGRGEAA